MKNRWHSQPFEACIETVTYTRKVLRKDFLDEGAYPIVSQEEDFINGYWNNEADLFRVKNPIVIFGDHTKVLKYVDFDFVLGADGVKILRPQSFLLSKFFFYQLQETQIKSLGYARHYKVLKELMIAYPSILVQRRIVGILDEAFEEIDTVKANANKNLLNVRVLFESHLQHVFAQKGEGWIRTAVGNQLTLQRGFDITKAQQSEGHIPVVSSGGIRSFHNQSMAKAPGVVIGRKGTLGKAFYLESDFWPHDTTLWVKDFKGNRPKFVYHFLRSIDVKQLDSGAANPALNRNNIHSIEVNWPNADMQDSIVKMLDSFAEEVQHLEFLYAKKLMALEALRKSLLHQAFTGQL